MKIIHFKKQILKNYIENFTARKITKPFDHFFLLYSFLTNKKFYYITLQNLRSNVKLIIINRSHFKINIYINIFFQKILFQYLILQSKYSFFLNRVSPG